MYKLNVYLFLCLHFFQEYTPCVQPLRFPYQGSSDSLFYSREEASDILQTFIHTKIPSPQMFLQENIHIPPRNIVLSGQPGVQDSSNTIIQSDGIDTSKNNTLNVRPSISWKRFSDSRVHITFQNGKVFTSQPTGNIKFLCFNDLQTVVHLMDIHTPREYHNIKRNLVSFYTYIHLMSLLYLLKKLDWMPSRPVACYGKYPEFNLKH
jgi:hypothetical protein